MKPGLFVAIRYARQHPLDDEWNHVAAPAVYRVVSVALPYVALEDLASGRKLPADVCVFEFEQLRPEFVAALFPDKMDRTSLRIHNKPVAEERDEQGYRRPVRVMTIK